MKKIILLTAIIFLLFLAGCNVSSLGDNNNGKINIVATLFPQYDFTRQIAGDRANVTLLLTAGMESHSYEPTPGDIIKIEKADLFIYTGEYMEVWAKSIIDSISSKVHILDVSNGITLAEAEANHSEEEHGHLEGLDPHIWTNPLNAKKIVDNILLALCKIDPDNSEYYTENAASYKKELDLLDADIENMVKNSARKDIIFAGRFALQYFFERYGLSYVAAFDSCSAETEPSVKVMMQIITKIKDENITSIYYEELTDPKVAKAISEETGVKILLFHSCHNVTLEELQNNVTYIDLMRQNTENLKEGLQ